MEKTPSTNARRTPVPVSKPDFRLGDRVQVVDDEKLLDLHIYGKDRKAMEEFMSLSHKRGVVVKLDNQNVSASPKDPMIIVEFKNKVREAFWSEELKHAPRD